MDYTIATAASIGNHPNIPTPSKGTKAPPAIGQNGPWWFAFYQTPDIPETLIEGKELDGKDE